MSSRPRSTGSSRSPRRQPAGGNATEIAKANNELAKGDAEGAPNEPATAIDLYCTAWEDAPKA